MKPGDVVQLLSGGALMTVASAVHGHTVTVYWMAANGQCYHLEVPTVCLTVATKKADGSYLI
jgi:uncharacterized protein YodC (DUF2158 family)